MARSDLELIARFLTRGDRDALGEVLARHESECYGLALHVTRSAADAEDACQEAIARAIRDLERFQPTGSFRAWLLRLTYCAAADLVRSRGARRAREEAAAAPERPARHPSERAEQAELDAAVRSALARVEPRYRMPVVLRYERELSYREAAQVLDLPEGTVRTYASRGLAKLRERLSQAGFALAPVALAGLVKSVGVAAAPATLTAALGKLAAGVSLSQTTVATGGGAGALAAAAKGGIGMKLIAGAFLAGAVAAGVAISTGGGQGPEPLASPGDPPKLEHFAVCADREYLDGPRLEAMNQSHKLAACDEKGNLFFVSAIANGALRVARADNGMVETVTSDDRWGTDLGLAEGPASAMPDLAGFVGCGSGGGWIRPVGDPIAGEENGHIYIGAMGESPYKLYRNAEKGNRWWFRRIGGTGKETPPATVGQSAPLDRINLAGVRMTGQADLMVWRGNLYRFEEEKNRLTCLLTIADYEKVAGRGSPGRSGGGIDISEDGWFYVMHFKGNALYRVSADRKKGEHVVQATKQPIGNQDGPGLKTRYHCGPYEFQLHKHFVFLKSIDSNSVRRFDGKNGRVSTLCTDGEFRERGPQQKRIEAIRGKGWLLGQADGASYIYIPYPGEERAGLCGIWRFGPIDPCRPTTGPLVK